MDRAKYKRIKAKEWYKNNKERAKKRIKKWQKENPERVKEYKRNWNKNNKEYFEEHRSKNKEQYSTRYKKYYAENISYKVALLIRNRINHCLSSNTNKLSAIFFIGCEIDYLMYHIQEQFTKGMSWDNHGEWYIDHIIACRKFDLSNRGEQLKCFHYTNLQPLWAEDNLKKRHNEDINEYIR